MNATRRLGPLALLLAVASILACSRGGGSVAVADPPERGGTPAESIALDAGGERGRATLYGPASGLGVVIVPGEPDGSWAAVAADLARNGYRVLLVEGDGGAVPAALIRAADEALRGRGVDKTILIGAGAAIGPLLATAPGRASGVVALNPRPPLDVAAAAGLDAPLLALASLGDGESSVLARRLSDAAPAGRVLALYPARASGAAVFTDAEASEVKTVILGFLRDAFQPRPA